MTTATTETVDALLTVAELLKYPTEGSLVLFDKGCQELKESLEKPQQTNKRADRDW